MSDQLAITYVAISDLHGADYNPRLMEDVNLQLLIDSISRFDMVDPIIARKDGLVIGGHQRLKAAQSLGLSEVPVVYLDVDDATAKAMNVALNNSSLQGTWDDDKLAGLLEELRAEDKLDWTGFDDDYLDGLLSKLTPDTDSVPMPKEQWMILIDCGNEQLQAKLLERFQGEGLDCKALIS